MGLHDFLERMFNNKLRWSMKKFCFSLLLVFPILVFGQLRNADVYKLPEMGKENIRENIVRVFPELMENQVIIASLMSNKSSNY